jgi:Arc/MetJ-type ribon-helix-helix transcriptional regulator
MFIMTSQISLAMSRKDYRSLTLPAGLYLELEKFVAESNGYYVSVAEVVREALRDYLRKRHEE